MSDDVDTHAAWLGFQQLVFSDPELQRLLHTIENRQAFIDVVVRLALERGVHIDAECVRTRLRESRPLGHRVRI